MIPMCQLLLNNFTENIGLFGTPLKDCCHAARLTVSPDREFQQQQGSLDDLLTGHSFLYSPPSLLGLAVLVRPAAVLFKSLNHPPLLIDDVRIIAKAGCIHVTCAWPGIEG